MITSVYIASIASDIENYWSVNPSNFCSVSMVFHYGSQDGDLIIAQCHKTARLVAEKLSLEDSDWTISFQSRFGKAEWLKPYTTSTIVKLARERILKITCYLSWLYF